jgi:signal transduction histidine kinase
VSSTTPSSASATVHAGGFVVNAGKGGSASGWSIARAEAHHGAIGFCSAEGAGTIFPFDLPIAPPE